MHIFFAYKIFSTNQYKAKSIVPMGKTSQKHLLMIYLFHSLASHAIFKKKVTLSERKIRKKHASNYYKQYSFRVVLQF